MTKRPLLPTCYAALAALNTLEQSVVKAMVVTSLLLMTVFDAKASDCLVLGDSIAVGIGQGLSGCAVQAKEGRTTRQIIGHVPKNHYYVAIISAGSNDGERASLVSLRMLRSYIQAQEVVWVIPSSKFKAALFVQYIAQEFGDRTISLDRVLSNDYTHPTNTGYRLLSSTLAQFYQLK
ncbi:hypothetical protein ACFFU8_09525 [Chromobacterium piscinae]|uniref:hypothetical protein n=1 Tax=Chromobacterium piscinae TaxID=686831 RepID=UPI001E58B229|nr:hypothetical protein [Chromobacterium piscinae]MCD5327856.1 hypothetical protein [Chromobacterium piscinae]